jgi:hypothetical protein
VGPGNELAVRFQRRESAGAETAANQLRAGHRVDGASADDKSVRSVRPRTPQHGFHANGRRVSQHTRGVSLRAVVTVGLARESERPGAAQKLGQRGVQRRTGNRVAALGPAAAGGLADARVAGRRRDARVRHAREVGGPGKRSEWTSREGKVGIRSCYEGRVTGQARQPWAGGVWRRGRAARTRVVSAGRRCVPREPAVPHPPPNASSPQTR